MALVSIPITDYAGRQKNLVVHLEDGFTLADYAAWVDAYTLQLDNVTAGVIGNAVLRSSLPPNAAVKATADPNDDIVRGALLTYDTAGRYNWSLWVPAAKDAIVTGEDITVAGAVATLNGLMVDGIVVPGGTIEPHNGYDQDLTSFLSAKRTDRPK